MQNTGKIIRAKNMTWLVPSLLATLQIHLSGLQTGSFTQCAYSVYYSHCVYTLPPAHIILFPLMFLLYLLTEPTLHILQPKAGFAVLLCRLYLRFVRNVLLVKLFTWLDQSIFSFFHPSPLTKYTYSLSLLRL